MEFGAALMVAFLKDKLARAENSRYSRYNNSARGILRTRRYRGSQGGLEIRADQSRRARARKREFLSGLLENEAGQ
jgi:hypothetical protein